MDVNYPHYFDYLNINLSQEATTANLSSRIEADQSVEDSSLMEIEKSITALKHKIQGIEEIIHNQIQVKDTEFEDLLKLENKVKDFLNITKSINERNLSTKQLKLEIELSNNKFLLYNLEKKRQAEQSLENKSDKILDQNNRELTSQNIENYEEKINEIEGNIERIKNQISYEKEVIKARIDLIQSDIYTNLVFFNRKS